MIMSYNIDVIYSKQISSFESVGNGQKIVHELKTSVKYFDDFGNFRRLHMALKFSSFSSFCYPTSHKNKKNRRIERKSQII